MRAHTRRRHIKHPHKSFTNTKIKDDEAIGWRDAAAGIFGNLPNNAINLHGLRNREGMTQAQLGELIGVDQSNISKMERGLREIGVKIAKKLGEHFNIDYRLFL